MLRRSRLLSFEPAGRAAAAAGGRFRLLLSDEDAQGLVEYSIIIALVALVAVAAVKFFGARTFNSLNNSANAMPNN